ncbi:MAG: hypothetical protein U0939_03510 [Pirellulales bacterium]
MATTSSTSGEFVARIQRASNAQQVVDLSKQLLRIGLKRDLGWMPRGTLASSAKCGFESESEERTLLDVWRRCTGDEARWIVAVLERWGGAASADEFCQRVVASNSDGERTHLLRALGILGGQSAVTALAGAMLFGDEKLADLADWHLRELAVGGSVDASQASTKVSPTFMRDVLLLVDWNRLESWAPPSLDSRRKTIAQLSQRLATHTSKSSVMSVVEPLLLAVEYPWPKWVRQALIARENLEPEAPTSNPSTKRSREPDDGADRRFWLVDNWLHGAPVNCFVSQISPCLEAIFTPVQFTDRGSRFPVEAPHKRTPVSASSDDLCSMDTTFDEFFSNCRRSVKENRGLMVFITRNDGDATSSEHIAILPRWSESDGGQGLRTWPLKNSRLRRFSVRIGEQSVGFEVEEVIETDNDASRLGVEWSFGGFSRPSEIRARCQVLDKLYDKIQTEWKGDVLRLQFPFVESS